MPEIVYSPDSVRDLQDIWDYIAEDSEFQADKHLQRLRSKLEYLSRWNTLGRPHPELTGGCRSYPIGKSCIYFRPIDTGIG